MSKQDNGTGKVHQLHPVKATKTEPLEGWTAQTKYETLRLPDGVNCVRLADVHALMAKDGKPFDMAVSEMFQPLLFAADDVCKEYREAEAIRIVSALHLVKPTGFPVPLFEPATSCTWDEDPLKCENVHTFSCRTIFPKGPKTIEKHVFRYVPQITFAGGLDIKTLRAAFPDQAHDLFEDGTIAGLVYALSIGAKQVLTAGVDPQTDVVATWERKNEAEAENHHGIKWPRHEIVSGYLNRLAVPIDIAHELWGWGRPVTVEAETKAAPAGESETGKQTHHKWPPEKRQKLLDDFNKASGKLQKEKLAQVAKQWGLREDNASKQIKLARKAQKPNFGTGLGGRKST